MLILVIMISLDYVSLNIHWFDNYSTILFYELFVLFHVDTKSRSAIYVFTFPYLLLNFILIMPIYFIYDLQEELIKNTT